MTADKKYIVHLGIIDYLQDFNFKKIIEMKYKKMQATDYKQEIAAVPAEIYGKRFQKFLKENVFREIMVQSWQGKEEFIE